MSLLTGNSARLGWQRLTGGGQAIAAWSVLASISVLTSCALLPKPTVSDGARVSSPQPAATVSSVGQNRRIDPEWAKIHRWGALRVGLDPAVGYDYFFSDAASDTYDGFEWHILQIIAEEIGVEIQVIPTPWRQQLDALEAGRVDVIWGAREPEGLDETRFLATLPYYEQPQALLVRSDRDPPIREFPDLFGLRVGVVSDSTGAAFLTTFNEQRGRAIRIFASRDLDRIVEQLHQDELDVVVVERPIATALARASRDRSDEDRVEFEVAGAPVMSTPLVGVVQAKRSSIKDVLDRAIADLKGKGKLDRILDQWQL